MVAVGVIIVIIVIGIITANDSATALAGRIVIIVARIAERHTVCACVVVCPYSVTTVFTGDGFAVVAVIAEYAAFKSVIVIGFNRCSAAAANGASVFAVVHGVFLLISILLPKAWWNGFRHQ